MTFERVFSVFDRIAPEYADRLAKVEGISDLCGVAVRLEGTSSWTWVGALPPFEQRSWKSSEFLVQVQRFPGHLVAQGVPAAVQKEVGALAASHANTSVWEVIVVDEPVAVVRAKGSDFWLGLDTRTLLAQHPARRSMRAVLFTIAVVLVLLQVLLGLPGGAHFPKPVTCVVMFLYSAASLWIGFKALRLFLKSMLFTPRPGQSFWQDEFGPKRV